MARYSFYADRQLTCIGSWITKRVARLIYGWGQEHTSAARPVIIELGPGHGEFAEVALGNDCRIVAIEMNLMLCRRLQAIGADVIRGICPPIPCRSEVADWTHASHLLEHMKNPDEARQLVAEMSRVTKCGGIVTLAYPDFGTYPKHFWNCDYTHAFPTSPRRVEQIGADVGLELVSRHAVSGFVTFGPLRLIADVWCHVYDHSLFGRLLDGLAGAVRHPEFFYKCRTSFNQSFLSVFKKKG